MHCRSKKTTKYNVFRHLFKNVSSQRKYRSTKPWVNTSRSTGKVLVESVTQVCLFNQEIGVWTKEEADKAAERAKKKAVKNQRKEENA